MDANTINNLSQLPHLATLCISLIRDIMEISRTYAHPLITLFKHSRFKKSKKKRDTAIDFGIPASDVERVRKLFNKFKITKFCLCPYCVAGVFGLV